MTTSSSPIEQSGCNCGTLRKASRRMSQLYDSALAPSGLKSTQFAMLTEIERRASQPPAIRDLAEALVMDQSTIGQNLRPLERDGLISLEPDASDRRSRRVKLTEEGRSRLMAARPLWKLAQLRFESSFGKLRAANLRAELMTIVRDQVFVDDGEMPPPAD